MAIKAESQSDIEDISIEEASEMFDARARSRLGISGDEFVRRYDEGDLEDLEAKDHSAVFELTLMVKYGGIGACGEPKP